MEDIILYINDYFLTTVKAYSIEDAKKRISHLTTDEYLFESVLAFDTLTDEGDISIEDSPEYIGVTKISFEELKVLVHEFNDLYVICEQYRQKISDFYNSNEYIVNMSEEIIHFLDQKMSGIYWSLRRCK